LDLQNNTKGLNERILLIEMNITDYL
jgi:hypothetical protein